MKKPMIEKDLFLSRRCIFFLVLQKPSMHRWFWQWGVFAYKYYYSGPNLSIQILHFPRIPVFETALGISLYFFLLTISGTMMMIVAKIYCTFILC